MKSVTNVHFIKLVMLVYKPSVDISTINHRIHLAISTNLAINQLGFTIKSPRFVC